MTKRNKVLEQIWLSKINDWDRIYGTLPESLATHYGHSGATEIMINAKGQKIDIIIEGMLMPYKFENENEESYRITIEHLTMEELEGIFRNLS